MKVHQWVTDPTGVVHRWVLDSELLLFDQHKASSLERLMLDWWWLSIPFALFYIIAVFVGQTWMTKRGTKFELRQSLIVWNTCLAIFSLWGACRCVPELVHSLTHHGLRHSVCNTTYLKGVTGLWVWLFMASKVPETIDTLFVVLRRQQLIFLHWFHHASVLVYCFYSYALFASTGRWFVSMNFCVHTLMYTYFALRAARIRVPRSMQQVVTLLQLLQMVVGCAVNGAVLFYKQRGYSCETSDTNVMISLALYGAYLILFAHFFYSTYLRKSAINKSKDRID